MNKIIEPFFSRAKTFDAICLLFVIVTALVTRIVLINEAPFVYAQDAYVYVSEAKDFAYNGSFEIRTGLPFIFSLGVSFKLLSPFFGDLLVSRMFMLLGSLVMFIVLFKIGQKIAGSLFGLFACLLAIFEPYCLKYSTVPYLEVFVIATSLLALYFALSRQKLQTILSPLFFYIAVLTRPEFYVPLFVPLVFIYVYKNCRILSKQEHKRLLLHFSFVLIVYVLPLIVLSTYVNSWGAFRLLERIQLFMTPELLLATITSVFRFYNQQFLNQLLCFFVLLILGFTLLISCFQIDFSRTGKKIKLLFKSKLNTSYLFSEDNRMFTFCIILFSILYLFVITLFAYSYTWNFYVVPNDLSNIEVLHEAVLISSSLHDRYLILLRLLISFPLAYPVTVLAQRVWDTFAK